MCLAHHCSSCLAWRLQTWLWVGFLAILGTSLEYFGHCLMNFGPIFHNVLHSFGMFFRKGPKMKTCKFHCKLKYILKIGQNKQTWNLASKLSKNGVKIRLSKIIEFGVIFGAKMLPWGLPGPKPSLTAPREPKGVPRQPLCLLFCPLRHPLWASSNL